MPRNYSKYNSTRAEAAFNQKAFESVFIASNATAAAATKVAGQITGWADATTDVTLALVVGNAHGDSSEWAAISGGSLVLQPGTYRLQLNQTVTCTDADGCDVHWAITDDSFNLIHESNVATPHILSAINTSITLTAMHQFTIYEETAIRYHLLCEEKAAATSGVLGRGDFGQVLVFKVK